MCIYAQLQQTTDIHEPCKKETNCFLNKLIDRCVAVSDPDEGIDFKQSQVL